jgi:hypothetical protein
LGGWGQCCGSEKKVSVPFSDPDPPEVSSGFESGFESGLPDQQHAKRLRKRDNLLMGGWGGRGAESYDLKKAWSSINHSILSGFVHCYNRNKSSTCIVGILYICSMDRTYPFCQKYRVLWNVAKNGGYAGGRGHPPSIPG